MAEVTSNTDNMFLGSNSLQQQRLAAVNTGLTSLPNISQSQLPSKFASLNGPANSGTELVPYRVGGGAGGDSPDLSLGVTDRLRIVESRLQTSESGHRAVLDEVGRLRSELGVNSRRSEEAVREERRHMATLLEQATRTNQDAVSQLSQRLSGAEQALSRERSQIGELVEQRVRQLETQWGQQLASTSQQTAAEMANRGRTEETRLGGMERELEAVGVARHKMERVAFQMLDEMRSLRTRLDAQDGDLAALNAEVRTRSKHLEQGYQQSLENVMKQLHNNASGGEGAGAIGSYSAGGDSARANQKLANQKLTDLQDSLLQLRSRVDSETIERRNLEQNALTKINDLQKTLSNQSRFREEMNHQMQMLHKERDAGLSSEKLSIYSKINEVMDEVNSRMLDKDLKGREEQLTRQTDLEKLIRSEQESRIGFERELRHDNDRRWELLRQNNSEELNQLRGTIKSDKSKYVESMRRLDESLSLMECQMDENRKELSRIVSIEIKSRSKKEQHVQDRLAEVEEKISAATASLQHAIGGVAKKNAIGVEDTSKIKKMCRDVLEDQQLAWNRQVGDLEARVYNLQGRLANYDQKMDEKIVSATANMSAMVREKIESISLWQGSISGSQSELKTVQQQLKQEIYELNEAFVLLKAENQSRMLAERETRIQDVDSVRQDLDRFKASIPKDLATKKDVDALNNNVRKIAESLQTVKTVLGMKIQSEQKLRIEEVKNLQDQLIQLRNLIEPVIHERLPPKLFIKPVNPSRGAAAGGGGADLDEPLSRVEMEMASPAINQWSIYSAYRWLHMKSRLMYFKWKNSNRRHLPPQPQSSRQPPPQTPEPQNERPPANTTAAGGDVERETHPWDPYADQQNGQSTKRDKASSVDGMNNDQPT